MGVNQRIIGYALLIAFFLTGCSYERHAAAVWDPFFTDLPEQVYICPKVNAFKHSKVGVFRFSEPLYACGTGMDAAGAVFDDLLEQGVFSYIINEAVQEHMGTADILGLARSRGYDLIITGDVLYYFEGSELKPSSVTERIRVVHVPTSRILWSATAKSLAHPVPSVDYFLFQTRGGPARPADGLVKENAAKFSNMLLKLPQQENSIEADTDILSYSQNTDVEAP